MNNSICGLELPKIRKAYFSGKLEKMLVDIQASGDYSSEEYEKLKSYLSTLRKKDELLNQDFASFLPKIAIDEPDLVLDEMNREQLTLDEAAQLAQEENNRKAAVQHASQMLKGIFIKFRSTKPPTNEELMDTAFELLSLEYFVLREKIYLERLYRKKIVEVERTGRQRKLAEEFAKITVEYRNFALIEGLLEQMQEFIMLAKKRYKDL